MEKLKYSTLLNYILHTLTGVKSQHPDLYISLSSILEVLKYPVNFSGIIDIAKYLETRGWIKAKYILGDVRIQITTQGLIHIEDINSDGKLHEDLGNYLREISEKHNYDKDKWILPLFEPTEDSSEKVIELIDNLIKNITSKENYKIDFINDLQIIKLELQKQNPDYRLIDIKLSNSPNLDYLINDIQLLKEYISIFN